MTSLVNRAARVFDGLERRLSGARARRAAGSLLVVGFLGALLFIELNRQGLFPGRIGRLFPTNHFHAVGFAFSVLLVIEVLGLVWALVGSVANSVGKQFELLALILLRKAFLEFGSFAEPIRWASLSDAVLPILSDTVGALLIFVVLGFYYRFQEHRPITESREEEKQFVAAKKGVALLLLLVFVGMGAWGLWLWGAGRQGFPFFAYFYTVLIFSDVLILLISLRYSSGFHVVFRNSGFALATVMIRIALTAPPHVNALLGVGAAVYVLGLSLSYNAFAPVIRTEEEPEEEWRTERERTPGGPFFG